MQLPLLLRKEKVVLASCLILVILSQNHKLSESKPQGSFQFHQINKRLSQSPKITDIMSSSNQKKNKEISSESSALRELKEIIKLQASEIEMLKKSIKTTNTAPISTHATLHHGSPPSEGDSDDPQTYLASPFYKLALKRVGWLSIFLCSLSITAIIMRSFEHTLSRQIELAYFVPLLAGHGGNTGGQIVGTVLSSLSNGSIQRKDASRVIRKEALSGLTVGVLLGSIVAPLAYYVGGISLHVATVLFCTLPLLSTIAATLASSIPFACEAIGIDPALIAAPAMTSFVDVSGLLSYFLIANKVFELFGLEL